jgi:hypothetical protein
LIGRRHSSTYRPGIDFMKLDLGRIAFSHILIRKQQTNVYFSFSDVFVGFRAKNGFKKI